MQEEMSPTEVLAAAARFSSAGNHDAAADTYRRMLLDPQLARWLFDNGRILSVCQAFIASLYYAGHAEESLSAFAHFASTLDPIDDASFDSMYIAGLRRTGSPPIPFGRRHRFRSLLQQLKSTAGVPGEVTECGCFRGLSSYLMCSVLRAEGGDFNGRGYHVFDSFQGLSQPGEKDRVAADAEDRQRFEAMTKPGHFAAPIEAVQAALADFPEVGYHPGWIPGSFAGLPEREYRFVHVDVDLYEPTRGALEYFYPRLASGGRIVSDDYNWAGARRAIEEFCSSRSIEFEVTEFTQAYIVK